MIDRFIDRLLVREGGYVNHPNDRGGPTNYGVTQAVLAEHRGEPVTVSDVQDLSPSEARAIYRQRYWEGPGLDTLPVHAFMRELLFDTAVNSGPRTAVRLLQRAAGVKDDGVVGPKTRAAVHRFRSRDLAAKFLAQRGLFYGEIIGGDNGQAVFRDGWANRLAEFIGRMDEA